MGRKILLLIGASAVVTGGVGAMAGCENLDTPARPDAGSNATASCILPSDPVVPCGSQYVLGDPGADLAGAGQMRSWAKMDPATNKALEFTISMPLDAVQTLNQATVDSSYWVEVPQPIKAQTVLQSFRVDYLSQGHPPAGVYNTRHLDFHIFIMSKEQALAISCQPQADKTFPPEGMLPAGWALFDPPLNCVPVHGMPAVNRLAPEFNGVQFVTAVGLTFYKSTFASWEPKLATQAMLERRPEFTFDLALMKGDPQSTMPRGLYPTKMVVTYDQPHGAYLFAIKDFQQWPPP
ncbi:hypothetical protein [Pendulispora albinea]|uniref:DUF5602 domain-containing protein n=1 Tax=Pendulispora albinea TaxID=2741071 RepID=A0ABZ2LSS5_9BACT